MANSYMSTYVSKNILCNRLHFYFFRILKLFNNNFLLQNNIIYNFKCISLTIYLLIYAQSVGTDIYMFKIPD